MGGCQSRGMRAGRSEAVPRQERSCLWYEGANLAQCRQQKSRLLPFRLPAT